MNATHAHTIALLLAAGLLAGCAGQPVSEPRAGAEPTHPAAAELSDEERLALLEDQAPVAQRTRHDHRSRLLGRGHDVTVYTQEDLRNTGRVDLSEALRMLDPRFQ